MLQKSLNYGVNAYQVPFIPKAARSARRRGPVQKKVEDTKMCAFDLLATVAGKLLLDGGSYEDTSHEKYKTVTAGDVIKEQYFAGNLQKHEHCDEGGVEVPFLPLNPSLQGQTGHCNDGKIGSQHDMLTPIPATNLSDCLEKDGSLDKMVLHDDKGELCSNLGKHEGCSAVHLAPCFPNMNEYVEQHGGDRRPLSGDGLDTDSLQDPKFLDREPPAGITLNSNVNLSLGKDQCLCGSLSPSRGNNFKVVTRNDGKNTTKCTQPNTMKTTRSLVHIGDRRIRKLLASKYWRVGPKMKFADLFDTELHCMYRSRKVGYKHQRSQRIYPFKKRKLFQCSSFSNSDGDIGRKGFCNSPGKAIDKTASGFCAAGHGVNDPSSCVAVQSTTFASRDSRVKLRIQSFRVPELFFEMPETETIGSLKRTVMEAVTALLEGGLHVGVLLQGQMVRDDSRTLSQSGICLDDKVDSLGFTLEPNPSHASLPVCFEDKSLMYSTVVTEPVSSCPGTRTIHLGTHVSSDHPVTNLGNLIESVHDSAPSPAEISVEKGRIDSQALVALPEGTSQARAAVAANQKSKRLEIGRRRIRRPFSVVEVEALVEAVEKLGTGRWRDVKLRAFNHVMHRTYVDLKDKWKTLVHTATISPHQRRGKPVPQGLLDRVLAAHAFWSQEQAK